MNITVSEFSNDPSGLEQDWQDLIIHISKHSSDLVLLPEMPFSQWMAWDKQVDLQIWKEAIKSHDQWIPRLPELNTPIVIGTRPVLNNGKCLNEGFVWDAETGYHPVHNKYYLPNEKGFWEANWYERGAGDFNILQFNQIKIGFLICTEIWFNSIVREYSRQGIHLLVCPRATGKATVDKWVAGGRAAAVVSGAFCLSSNFGHSQTQEVEWGGKGWIIDPEEGDILGLTSSDQRFVTREIDIKRADQAKQTYPRYVLD